MHTVSTCLHLAFLPLALLCPIHLLQTISTYNLIWFRCLLGSVSCYLLPCFFVEDMSAIRGRMMRLGQHRTMKVLWQTTVATTTRRGSLTQWVYSNQPLIRSLCANTKQGMGWLKEQTALFVSMSFRKMRALGSCPNAAMLFTSLVLTRGCDFTRTAPSVVPQSLRTESTRSRIRTIPHQSKRPRWTILRITLGVMKLR